MAEPTKRKKKGEDEVTLAKSIFDEIVAETECDNQEKIERRQDTPRAVDGKAFAVK